MSVCWSLLAVTAFLFTVVVSPFFLSFYLLYLLRCCWCRCYFVVILLLFCCYFVISPACNACGKNESLAHAFFECEEAYKIWREIKPKLSEILDGKNIQCFKLALKIFPPETTLAEKKMLTTIVQIAMHQIWLNRNFRKHERLKQNTQSSLNSIDWTFCKNIKRYFDTYSDEGNLQLFRQRFCQTPSICRVDEDGKLHVNIR